MSQPRSYAPAVQPRVIETRDATYLLAPDGSARRLDGDSAELARAVLDFVAVPRSRDELLAHVELLTGAPLDDASVVDALLVELERAGALHAIEGEPPAIAASTAQRLGARVVLALTGAVATALAPDLLSRLLARGFDVRVALTPDARRFVTVRALEAVGHARVATNLWRGEPDEPAPHIALAEWADVVVVCPASATTISRVAHGDCSELVAATCIATRAPLVIVPSMNVRMLEAPSVQHNLEQLRADGAYVVRSGHGVKLAHAPERRAAGVGPGPGHAAVVEIVAFVAAQAEARRASAWEARYAASALEALPWYTDGIDEDLEVALSALGDGRSVLELGAGPGSTAIALARRGHRVTATDLAPSAIAKARLRDGAEAVDWRVDDVTRTRLEGSFDVVLDRGCLHVLDAESAVAWASAVSRLVRAGGRLVVKCFAGEARLPGTRAYAATSLTALLGPAFHLERVADGRFVTHAGESSAIVATFRRL